MNNKIIKKLLALLSAGIINTTMLMGITASANTNKYSWNTYYGTAVYENGSSIPYHEVLVDGWKDTSSSIYIENNGYRDRDNFYCVYVTVYGRYSYEDRWTSHWVDSCPQYWGSLNTRNIRVRNGDKRLIRQYVNENGYQIAKVFIRDCAVRYSNGKVAFDTNSATQGYPTAN